MSKLRGQQVWLTLSPVAELIRRRRLQMLVHSCIYYELNGNLIPDDVWSKWAFELQQKYPEEAEFADWFRGWDGSTGAFLPLRDPWVLRKAQYLMKLEAQ